MLSGSLHVVLDNPPAAGSDAMYTILFFPSTASLGSMPQCSVSGDDALREFFRYSVLDQDMEPETREARVNEWMTEVRQNGDLVLMSVRVSEKLFER